MTQSRTAFQAKYQPYWSAPTPKIGLKRYYRSQISGDTRTCVWCEQEFDLEEFWSGSKFGWACSSDRAKAHKKRKQVEQEVAEANKGEDAKEDEGEDEGEDAKEDEGEDEGENEEDQQDQQDE
jgi:hypothetical protein